MNHCAQTTRNFCLPLAKIFITALLVIALDRASKELFLAGWQWHCEAFSLALVFNTGVAFSLLASLGGALKWLQIAMLVAAAGYLAAEAARAREASLLAAHPVAIAAIAAGGASNIADRFFYPGVVDFFAWHYGFNFAVFNLADVAINLGVALIFLQILIKKRS